jgi:hypothetical protein
MKICARLCAHLLEHRSPTDGPRENFGVHGEIWTLVAIFMFIILFHYVIMLFQTSSNKYHTNNFVIIKQVHFILIKWNFYDHCFIDVPFLKKFMLVVRGIQNCEFNGWRPLV